MGVGGTGGIPVSLPLPQSLGPPNPWSPEALVSFSFLGSKPDEVRSSAWVRRLHFSADAVHFSRNAFPCPSSCTSLSSQTYRPGSGETTVVLSVILSSLGKGNTLIYRDSGADLWRVLVPEQQPRQSPLALKVQEGQQPVTPDFRQAHQ